MPHATTTSPGPEPEDADFDNVMRQMNGPMVEGGTSLDFLNRELDPGEKADDAVDYEDFEDDELPEEEEITEHNAQAVMENGFDVPEPSEDAIFGGANDLFEEPEQQGQPPPDDLDDLFGEEPASPGPNQVDEVRDLFFEDEQAPMIEKQHEVPVEEDHESLPDDGALTPVPDDMDPAALRAWKLQQALFAMSNVGFDNPPAPPENVEELLQSLFPMFDRSTLPRFLELIPHKKAHFIGKQPVKPPKSVVPGKVNIELAQDQEKAFRSGGQAYKRSLESENHGVVPVGDTSQEEEEEETREDFTLDHESDEPLPGGITAEDLRLVCADWDVKDDISVMDVDEPDFTENNEDDWLFETTRPAKKRKLGRDPMEIVSFSHIDLPLLDDPEQVNSRVAQKVTLDLNDPHMLFDGKAPDTAAKLRASGARGREDMDANVTRRLTSRYNISNDQAYEMLKQNHQNKIRSTLGNVTLEHSMPALRLQWPYYKTELAKAEARSFHRPALSFRPGQSCWFKNTTNVKRKHQRGKDIRQIYDSTRALSSADNSHVCLVEYSEESPLALSNFGMANRIINYYRRKNMEDPTRPKAEIGETAVLLPQDKSPFSIFGHVDPGEVTPAISNSMYRAPLYPHQAKSTDFLVVRNSTGSGGSDYYLRNIDNMFVAGQQLPSVDIPGPHSRKVTTVAKNRMKMLVYRLLKKSPDLRLSISDVTAHIPGTSDMQNRQKVKDFLSHDKETKCWVPLEPVPEQDTIRSWVHPEDVCLLEAMQVGQQHLHDTGHGNDAETGGDDDNDEESESFEQQMAPWKASRNFLLASQGKAMLKLHGEGDPTGRGEGFSFIKTSMKGGFKAIGESVEDKLDAQRLKELGGHSYNVARQQKSYETSIRRIWDAQKASLSSTVEHSDEDVGMSEEEEDDFNKPTPRSEAPTPAPARRDDETTSQFSKMSRLSFSQQKDKVLRIVRQIKDKDGVLHPKETVVSDPRVIRHYLQHRHRVESVTTK